MFKAKRQPRYSGAVRRAKRAGLSMSLGCLGGVPDTNPTERATYKAYHFRPPKRRVRVRRYYLEGGALLRPPPDGLPVPLGQPPALP